MKVLYLDFIRFSKESSSKTFGCTGLNWRYGSLEIMLFSRHVVIIINKAPSAL